MQLLLYCILDRQSNASPGNATKICGPMDHLEKASNCHPSHESLTNLSSHQTIYISLHQSYGGNSDHRGENYEGSALDFQPRE